MVGLKEIQEARSRVSPFVHKTPLLHCSSFSRIFGADIFLKAENLQKTGSFKVRGAFNKLSSVSGRKVIAASMGNHAQGVAFAAERLGKQARVVMPVTSPIVKQEATRGYGAEVVLRGESFQEALDFALSQKDHVFIHAFDDDEVIAGQGIIGVEIHEEIGDLDFVFVPVGGGGLISGVAAALKSLSPKTKIIGVQTSAAPSASVSLKGNKVSAVVPSPTIADGIAVGRVGERTLEIMNRYVDEMLLVDEEPIAMSVLLFLERTKLVVEGAGAVPLAALMGERERFRGKKVLLLVSGGNIDFTLIDRIIHKGLVTSGRIGVFEVTVNDVPGQLHALTGVISDLRGNILHVDHDRLALDLSVSKTRVVFTVETKGQTHLEEILSEIRKKGFEVGRR